MINSIAVTHKITWAITLNDAFTRAPDSKRREGRVALVKQNYNNTNNNANALFSLSGLKTGHFLKTWPICFIIFSTGSLFGNF